MLKGIPELSYILIFLIILSLVLLLFSPITGSPVTERDFTGFSPGARSLAMGNVGIALPGDPFVSFYNPAAVCFIKNNYLLFDFLDMRRNSLENHSLPEFAGIAIDFISIVNPSGGLTWHPLASMRVEEITTLFSDELQETLSVESKIEYRTDEFYLTLTTLASEMLGSLAGVPLFGINIKYYKANLAVSEVKKSKTTPVDASSNIDTGNGFGIDLGFAYVKGPFLFGFAVKDIFSKVYWTDYESDRIHTKIGAGFSTFFLERWILSTDLRYDSGLKKTGLYTGIESRFFEKKKEKKKLNIGQSKEDHRPLGGGFLRFGARLDDLKIKEDVVYSLGFGYSLSRFCVDIAFFGDKELIKEKSISSQVSILVIY